MSRCDSAGGARVPEYRNGAAATVVTASSGLPSPSMSTMVRPVGLDPVIKSTLAANEPVVMAPEVQCS